MRQYPRKESSSAVDLVQGLYKLKWKPDERSSLGLSARESMENRYDSYQEEKVW